MKKNGLRIFSGVCALIGLALCILAIVKGGEQPLPALGLAFVNLAIWPTIIANQKAQKEKEKHE